MSLLPPNAFTMSKLWFHIENKVKNTELKEKIHDLLGPYYEFRIDAKFRPIVPDEKGNVDEYTLPDSEIVSIIDEGEDFTKQNTFICIDKCLNMYTRLRTKLLPKYEDRKVAGILGFTVQYRERGSKLAWNDSYKDEKPICLNSKVEK